MDFATAISTCMVKKYADFSGRASRSEFWFCQLFFLIIGFIVGIIDAMVLGYVYEAGPFELISYVIIIIPAIAVTARRLHDVNLSGWWQLIALTIVGIPIYLYWLIIKGTDGNNDFGSDPIAS